MLSHPTCIQPLKVTLFKFQQDLWILASENEFTDIMRDFCVKQHLAIFVEHRLVIDSQKDE